jgi:hypothetical protein
MVLVGDLDERVESFGARFYPFSLSRNRVAGHSRVPTYPG